MESKLCRTCGEVKPIDQFSRRKDRWSGYTSKCKSCHNKYYKEYWKNTEAYEKHKQRSRRNAPKKRAAKYGLTIDQVDRLFADASGMCEICGDKPATCIDHDHVKGRVRGVLCRECNSGLGRFGDTIEGLQKAINYLARVLIERVNNGST